MNLSFPVILQALQPILGYMVCPLETCCTIAIEHQHVQKQQIIAQRYIHLDSKKRFVYMYIYILYIYIYCIYIYIVYIYIYTSTVFCIC